MSSPVPVMGDYTETVETDEASLMECDSEELLEIYNFLTVFSDEDLLLVKEYFDVASDAAQIASMESDEAIASAAGGVAQPARLSKEDLVRIIASECNKKNPDVVRAIFAIAENLGDNFEYVAKHRDAVMDAVRAAYDRDQEAIAAAGGVAQLPPSRLERTPQRQEIMRAAVAATSAAAATTHETGMGVVDRGSDALRDPVAFAPPLPVSAHAATSAARVTPEQWARNVIINTAENFARIRGNDFTDVVILKTVDLVLEEWGKISRAEMTFEERNNFHEVGIEQYHQIIQAAQRIQDEILVDGQLIANQRGGLEDVDAAAAPYASYPPLPLEEGSEAWDPYQLPMSGTNAAAFAAPVDSEDRARQFLIDALADHARSIGSEFSTEMLLEGVEQMLLEYHAPSSAMGAGQRNFFPHLNEEDYAKVIQAAKEIRTEIRADRHPSLPPRIQNLATAAASPYASAASRHASGAWDPDLSIRNFLRNQASELSGQDQYTLDFDNVVLLSFIEQLLEAGERDESLLIALLGDKYEHEDVLAVARAMKDEIEAPQHHFPRVVTAEAPRSIYDLPPSDASAAFSAARAAPAPHEQSWGRGTVGYQPAAAARLDDDFDLGATRWRLPIPAHPPLDSSRGPLGERADAPLSAAAAPAPSPTQPSVDLGSRLGPRRI